MFEDLTRKSVVSHLEELPDETDRLTADCIYPHRLQASSVSLRRVPIHQVF
jgi:hypothetical protein